MNTRYGRSDRIRTCGIEVPNFARYQLRHTPITNIIDNFKIIVNIIAKKNGIVKSKRVKINFI